MRCPVAELQERMSASEYTEWMAYESISPWGPEREDMHFARLMELVLSALRSIGGERGQAVRWQDLMPSFEAAKPVDLDAEAEREYEAVMRSLTRG